VRPAETGKASDTDSRRGPTTGAADRVTDNCRATARSGGDPGPPGLRRPRCKSEQRGIIESADWIGVRQSAVSHAAHGIRQEIGALFLGRDLAQAVQTQLPHCTLTWASPVATPGYAVLAAE